MPSQAEQPVAFEGHCAFAVSTGKKDVVGKESCYLVHDGKKYVFSNAVAKFLWRIIPGRREKAESIWSAP